MEVTMKKILIIILGLSFMFQSNLFSDETKFNLKINDNYEETISKKDQKVILIFSAPWCKYCSELKNDLKDFDLKEYEIHIVNIDKNPDLKKEHSIKVLPTTVVLQNKKEINRKVGYEKNDYKNWLNEIKEEAK